MDLITNLLILVTVSRLLGRLAKSLGYLEIIGEILAGLILGPALLGAVSITPELTGVVELGVFLLMLSAGLEMEIHDIYSALKKRAFLCALSGFFLSLATGFGIGQLFDLGFLQSVCMGLVMAITALPVTVRFLTAAGLIDSREGHTIMSSAVIIDIASLLILGIIFDADSIRDPIALVKTVGITGGKMILFFALIILANRVLRSKNTHIQKTELYFKRLIDNLGEEAVFGVAVLFVLVFSTTSEALGFHFIIGAFFGGLLLSQDIIGKDYFKQLTHILNSVSGGFLTPVFFAYIGLRFSVGAFDQVGLLLVILAGGYLSKTLGSYWGARAGGFSKEESKKIGIILASRGTFDLVVAELAYERGYINSSVFSMLILLSIVTVLINPFVYRKLLPNALLKAKP